MRDIPVAAIGEALARCIEKASFLLGKREKAALQAGRDSESSPSGREILSQRRWLFVPSWAKGAREAAKAGLTLLKGRVHQDFGEEFDEE